MRKLEVGVQSGNWYDEKKPEESIRLIKDCGFEGIDYNICNLFDATFDAKKLTSFFDADLKTLFDYFAPMKNALQTYGVQVSQAHGPLRMYFPGEDAFNDYVIFVTEQIMAVCEYLDCRYLVIHPWSAPGQKKEVEVQANLNLYRRLMPAAKAHGIKICLENIFKHDNRRCIEGACSDVREACWYVDTLNREAGEEVFGFCFDTGHANVLGRNLYQFITSLGNRLKVLHIHENGGDCDDHMLPYTQADAYGRVSAINWEEFIRALKEIKYEGCLSFEIFRGIDAFPPELRTEGLRLASSIGRYFRKRIEE